MAGIVYPIENLEIRISLFLFEVAAVLGIIFEVVYLLLNYELNDLAILNWPDPPRHWLPNMRIDKWLKYEQIGLNLLTIGLFLVGFGFSYAVPRDAAASHKKVEALITDISSTVKAHQNSLAELKDIIAAGREEQARQQDAYFQTAR